MFIVIDTLRKTSIRMPQEGPYVGIIISRLESLARFDETYICHLQTNTFPKDEIYGLRQQIRRAAVSIASNIAEEKGHRSDREFVHLSVPCPRLASGTPDAIADSARS